MAKGLSGMGLPLIATPIVAGLFGPRPAVVIMSIPILVSNSLLLVTGWRGFPPILRDAGPMIATGVVGTIVGVQLLAYLDQRVFALIISGLVLLFLLRGDRLLGEDPNARRVRVAGPLIGLIGGLLQGSTSISSPLVGSYFHARRVSPADFVVVLAALFQINSMVQIATLSITGLYTETLFAFGLLSLVPSLLGLIAGIELRGRVSAATFRRIISVLLVLSIANLLWRTFGG